MDNRTTDAKTLDATWPGPPHPDDVRGMTDAMQDAVEESLRTAIDDAKTLVQIAKLMDTLPAYAQRATLDWLKAYYDEVC